MPLSMNATPYMDYIKAMLSQNLVDSFPRIFCIRAFVLLNSRVQPMHQAQRDMHGINSSSRLSSCNMRACTHGDFVNKGVVAEARIQTDDSA
jgi:hypothetical protein